MILSIRINNYLIYANEVELSLKADMRTKRFPDNVYVSDSKFNINKVVGIFGANNSGKTCLVRAIKQIRNVMMGENLGIRSNLFLESNRTMLGITFLYKERVYSYDFKYDSNKIDDSKYGFVYEKLSEITLDKYNNEKETIIFIKDIENNNFYFKDDKELSSLIEQISYNHPILYSVSPLKFPLINELRKMFSKVASDIVVIDMNDIPIDNTISKLKDKCAYKDLIVDFIKRADVHIDDFKYEREIDYLNDSEAPYESVLTRVSNEDRYFLVSTYKGMDLPSIIYDSKGTKQVEALSSYVIEALLNESVLVIDEIDNGLHSSLTRSIISMFLNETNKRGQLIFTTHDQSLLDTKRLFRKDQLYLLDKDEDNVYLYSLNEFTAQGDKVRGDTSILERYTKGYFGGVPRPDFIDIMLETKVRRDDGKKISK